MRYVLVENKETGAEAIRLLDEPFAGIIYEYGEIKLGQDEDKPKISFEYFIVDKNNKEFTDKGPFEECIGNVLQEILYETLSKENKNDSV